MPIADRQDSQSTAKTVEAPLQPSRSSIRLFISYARRDEDLRLELDDHLSNLQRRQIISGWYDRRIAPGQEWADQIDNALNEAQILFDSSQTRQSEEMKVILRRLETTTTTAPTPFTMQAPQGEEVDVAVPFSMWPLIVLIPLLLYATWFLWRWLRQRVLLQRLPDKRLPQLHELKVEGIERKLFASPRLRRLLLGLRRPRPLPVRELNVPAPAKAGGRADRAC